MPTWMPKQWILAVSPRCKVSDLYIVSRVAAGIWSYTYTCMCTHAHLCKPTWMPQQWALAVRPRCKVSDLCIVSRVAAEIWSYTEACVCTCTPEQAHLDALAVDPGCEAALQGERSVYCVKGGCWDLVIHRDIRMHMHILKCPPGCPSSGSWL
jgi:hypothetical protein